MKHFKIVLGGGGRRYRGHCTTDIFKSHNMSKPKKVDIKHKMNYSTNDQ